MARGSRCQHRSFVGTSLLVETVLVSGGTCCHARNVPESPEAATAQDSRDTSKTGVEGVRSPSYVPGSHSEHSKRDSESEQQNDVDMTGAGVGASGAAAAASGGASAGTVTAEKKRAQEEAKRRMERIQAALTQLGSGDDMKEVRDKLNQEMSRAKKASEPRHLANDIEGKAAWVSREARRLNELEADIAKLQAHLVQKRRDLQVEIQELDVLRAQLAKNTGCVGAGNQGNEPPMQELEKRELLILRELVAANVPSNLEAPGLDGSERSRKWHELREIQESIANKKQRVAPPENGL